MKTAGDTEVFQKKRFQGFIYENLRVVGPLGEKFLYFTCLGTNGISPISVHIPVSLLENFREQFELCFYSKYSKSYRFYNIDDKRNKPKL